MCLTSLAVATLSQGAFADVAEHALAAAELTRRPAYILALAALAATYAGDLERATALNTRAPSTGESLTARGFVSYTAGEIDNAAGRLDRAQRHYTVAIDLARQAGATFLAGLASVGLVTTLASAGRIEDALRGYRDVVAYFAATGNWTHLWVALRNLAALLRRLGETRAAELIDAAAEQAPDAPARSAGTSSPAIHRAAQGPGKTQVLDEARRAIERHLGGSTGG